MASVTDLLALDRTRLANERTFLAYLRTALGFTAAGATLVRLFPGKLADEALGIGLIVFGILLLVVGVWRCTTEHFRYVRMRDELL